MTKLIKHGEQAYQCSKFKSFQLIHIYQDQYSGCMQVSKKQEMKFVLSLGVMIIFFSWDFWATPHTYDSMLQLWSVDIHYC